MKAIWRTTGQLVTSASSLTYIQVEVHNCITRKIYVRPHPYSLAPGIGWDLIYFVNTGGRRN